MKMKTNIHHRTDSTLAYRECIFKSVGLTAVAITGDVRVIQPTHPDGANIFSVLELCLVEIPHYHRPLTTKETMSLIDVLRQAHNHASGWNKQKGFNLEEWL